MALPQLNDQPKYDLVIPSTKQKVKFRPFLVKEEKVLLMALETQDQSIILNTVVDTIKACVDEEINPKKLTTFDVEYSFLQIRSKSVGETAKLNFECSECQNKNEVVVKIDDIQIEVPQLENIIKINDEISVEMQWPSFISVLGDDKLINSDSTVDQMFALIRSSIAAIMTNEDRYSTADHTPEELNAFIESMNAEQFGKIRTYVEQMPRLQHEIEFVCTGCSSPNTHLVEGMQNFFS